MWRSPRFPTTTPLQPSRSGLRGWREFSPRMRSTFPRARSARPCPAGSPRSMRAIVRITSPRRCLGIRTSHGPESSSSSPQARPQRWKRSVRCSTASVSGCSFAVLQYNQTQGLFFGGEFWDGRATGFKLQSPDAEQAQHPPVDPGEMGFPDTACIALRISQAVYRPLFELVWGADFDINWPSNVEQICSAPGGNFPTATPIALSAVDRTKANNIYDHWGQSISFLEHTPDVSPFTSKYDAFLAGTPGVTLTADEMAGLQLFNGKGNCNSCHVDGRSTTLMPGQTDTGNEASVQPLFTCHGFTNEGLPLNPRVTIFYESRPDAFQFTPNPDGMRFRDLGIGTFLRSGPQTFPDPNQPQWLSLAATADGQMQVMTARDV